MRTSDVIVVGGGAVGCAAAYFLAREGLSVTLFERDTLAAHASGAAAGMLAPICESEGSGPFFEFGLCSLEMYPALTEELREASGIDPQLSLSGILRLAHTEAEAHRLRRQAAALARYDLEWLPADAARAREPHLSPSIHGALWSPREGHLYSPFLTRAYAGAAARRGARVECGVPVLDLIRAGDRIVGVRTAAGERGAGHVVLAAGVWTRFCTEWLGEPFPVEPVRGQILSLEAPQPPFRSIVWGDDVYLVPKRDGTVVVGATVERAGYDCRTTAAGLASLLQAAPQLVPSLAGCAFRQAWAGLRPDTPDQMPAVGPLPGIEGLTLAAGHYRNGVLLSAATGQLVADWIVRHDFPVFARPFLPQRLLRARK